jgi:hypothetical protein
LRSKRRRGVRRDPSAIKLLSAPQGLGEGRRSSTH